MKKIALTSLFLLMSALSSTVLSNQVITNAAGGFSGPGEETLITTVRGALDSGQFTDDIPVRLTGFIVRSLGDEKYLFKDHTGEIKVEIDNDKWFGLQATPTLEVIIDGEIDNEFMSKKIDVKRIRAK